MLKRCVSWLVPSFLSFLFVLPASALERFCQDLDLTTIPEHTICEARMGRMWQLVRRTETRHEVWKDLTSGLIWCDLLDGKYTFDQARDRCASARSLDACGNLTSVQFFVPSVNDYNDGLKNGMVGLVPQTWDHSFWTSDRVDFGEARFYRMKAGTKPDDIVSYVSVPFQVHCVGRE